MATTILAVDDSATMRKILEITFAGTDFQLVTVGSGDEALGQVRGGGVGLIICDNSLDGDGYRVAEQLKSAAPGTPLLFLSSRQNPYDAGKGAGAHVDDHIDKPFDTQQLIDRVNKLASGGVSAAAPAPAAAAPAPAAAAAAAPKSRTIGYGAAAPAPAPAPAPAVKTAGFGSGGLGTKPAAAPAAAPAAQARPANVATHQGVAPTPARAPAPAAAPAVAAASAAMSAAAGQVAAKVGEMGLSKEQADAITALSRDVIEKIVWEVVPILAETLIKEEIARLTK